MRAATDNLSKCMTPIRNCMTGSNTDLINQISNGVNPVRPRTFIKIRREEEV